MQAAESNSTGGNGDVLSIQIDKKLEQQNLLLPESCIYRVHSSLRNVNAREYEPILASIGPYHHGKSELREMEKYKIHYLKLLLQRRNENSTERLVAKMRSVVERASRCYSDTSEIDSSIDEFVEMMVLDGCFIIELFRKFSKRIATCEKISGDPIFDIKWYMNYLWRDLLLFENQLPLFVLIKLFELTKEEGETNNFHDLAIEFFIRGATQEIDENSISEIPHLLGLLYKATIVPSSSSDGLNKIFENHQVHCRFVPSATVLDQAGVKFKKINDKDLFSITFNNGVLEIPELLIQDHTEFLYRNLIAYEQYSKNHSLHLVTDYFIFMNCLVNTSKDVELLCRRGVIDKMSFTDEKVSSIFNQLGSSIYCESENFYYANIFEKLNKHCSRRYNLEMAKLWHDYFNSTWSLISFVAALLLLLLTTTQTIFTILSYEPPGSKN